MMKEKKMLNLEENNIYFYYNKNKLIENFNKFSKLGNIYYPLKTNSNGILIKTLQPLISKENNGFLISSINHFEKLKKLKVNPLHMCFINVLAEYETVKYLYNSGYDNLRIYAKLLQ